ncbi:MAG: hypothetical protein OQK35_03305 [Alphaproteobacteria bacterium]|nr:hypothetical protein [Rhodospirillales bacterium]MCW9045339.1 hypothetical protein [Alphaproteobacteria bacterium]
MSFDWFHPQDLIILLAVGFLGGLILAAHLSVRPKNDDAKDTPTTNTSTQKPSINAN